MGFSAWGTPKFTKGHAYCKNYILWISTIYIYNYIYPINPNHNWTYHDMSRCIPIATAYPQSWWHISPLNHQWTIASDITQPLPFVCWVAVYMIEILHLSCSNSPFWLVNWLVKQVLITLFPTWNYHRLLPLMVLSLSLCWPYKDLLWSLYEGFQKWVVPKNIQNSSVLVLKAMLFGDPPF